MFAGQRVMVYFDGENTPSVCGMDLVHRRGIPKALLDWEAWVVERNLLLELGLEVMETDDEILVFSRLTFQ